jgi:hypothetical protein
VPLAELAVFRRFSIALFVVQAHSGEMSDVVDVPGAWEAAN